MKRPNFKVGDKVFAKVKGYPPWPAQIVGENGKKWNVEFYGTGETGSIKSEDLFYFLKNKERFQKPLKRKDYIDAFEQIDEAIKKDGGDGDQAPDVNDSLANESLNSSNANISKTEKADKKTPAKRKRSLPEEVPAETSTPKKKSARLSKVSDASQKAEKVTEKAEKVTEKAEKVTEKSEKVAEKTDKSTEKVEKETEKMEEEEEEEEDVEVPVKGTEKVTPPKKSPKITKSQKSDKKEKNVEDVVTEDKEKEEPALEEKKPTEKVKDNDVDIKETTEKATGGDEKPEEKKLDIDIISEHSLKNNIAYAEHVKKSETIYKGRKVEMRNDHKNQVLPIKLPSGKMGGIKLHLTWPLEYDNEFDRAIYDETVAKRVLETKTKIEGGDLSITEDTTHFIGDIELSEEGVGHMFSLKDLQVKKAKMARMNIEAELLGLNVKIKNCLGLDKADPKEALGYLEEMCNLEFDDIVLKKHFHIIEMVRRLRKYVGNTREWKMNDESLNEFTRQAEKVREMAEKVYGKFKGVVKLPENCSSFFEGFTELVAQFRADCKELDMSETDIFELSAEPRSRQAFLTRLDEKETEKNHLNESAHSEQEKPLNGSNEVLTEEKV